MTGGGRNLARSGPKRREYQRARYLATRLSSTIERTETAAAERSHGIQLHDLLETASAFAELHERQPTDRSGHQLFAAVIAVGHSIAADADRAAKTAIALADCARPTIDPTTVTNARTKANEYRAQWERIRPAAESTLTDDEVAADPTFSVTERRWRRDVLADYRDSTAAFLEVHRQAYGHDDHFDQRAAIRARTYAEALHLTGYVRSERLAARARTDLDDLYRTYRPTLPGPTVCASTHHDPLQTGEVALREGTLGGLIGDGWRTADSHHRAFVLGAWGTP